MMPRPPLSSDDSSTPPATPPKTPPARGTSPTKQLIGPNSSEPQPGDEPIGHVGQRVKKLLDETWLATREADGCALKFVWSPTALVELYQLIEPLCAGCIQLLKQDEYPLLRLTSPAFVLGDIHGRFDDLYFLLSQFYTDGPPPPTRPRPLTVKDVRIAKNVLVVAEDGEYEINAMNKVPTLLTGSSNDLLEMGRQSSNFVYGKEALLTDRLLFLGDFVDRGFASLEVVLYVLALKAIKPATVHLLRGNHELPIINQGYGFLTQCQRLFGGEAGREVWAHVNRVFDFMPLAAILDEKIFCAHGGFPRVGSDGWEDRMPILQRKALWAAIRDSPSQWDVLQEEKNARFKEIFDDLLWADPAPEEVDLDENGFGPSVRGISVSYGTAAVDTFLEATGCSVILRAHEVQARGFNVCKGGRVITIFTSSYYDDNRNMAGAAFVSAGTIRAITRREA